ncbi:phosphotransferase family protein [Paenibacillus pinisoli]|uniref:Phosphotransferase family protein n=1 Tax=Paenibacillus pinisoli TaxID=1276110 RepID=A0A3A6PEN6_9BACL|nr:phosphotransferase [Paenibacillus pinisoli]RJX37248.1 phosphotransferase family protein [Paenibacillus pinisoli]
MTNEQAYDHEPFAQIAKKLNTGGELRDCRRLAGGISAVTTYIEVASSQGEINRYVVRQHGAADLSRDADIAGHEFELLRLLKQNGISVAQPMLYDASCAILPSPYIVAAYVEGQVELQPQQSVYKARQLASQLAAIHQVRISHTELPFLADMHKVVSGKLASRPGQLDDSLSEGPIREALMMAWPSLRLNEGTLLHGDYWPGNVLWKEGELAAVMDWEDAAWGDPLSDVGNARMELLWAYGEAAMEAFTEQYRQEMPQLAYESLPYWDLCAALRPASQLSGWGLDPDTERVMRERHAVFTAQALAVRHRIL